MFYSTTMRKRATIYSSHGEWRMYMTQPPMCKLCLYMGGF